jgi:hypothetical protein
MKTTDINKIIDEETVMLDSLRPRLSRKLLFALEEKLKAEKQELEQLLGLDKKQSQNLSKYTFVLNSQYFDQIFLN